MYKYFSELDNPSEFSIYLLKKKIDINNDRMYYVDNVYLLDNCFFYYEDLFKRIDIIDMMIKGSNEQIFLKSLNNLSWEERSLYYDFFVMKEEQYVWLEEDKKKVDFSVRDLENYLSDYLIWSNYLIEMYPDFKKFICDTREKISAAIKELKKKNYIELPFQSHGEFYKFPNAWYITPNGYLYNTGTGHKQGNLVYPLYYIIFNLLEQNRDIPNVNYFDYINKILKRGYVTSFEFKDYTNLGYDLPTIITPEIENEIERYNNILKLSVEEYEKLDKEQIPCTERSYQKNIITLIVGYLDARTCLFQSFRRLNSSNNKIKIRDGLFAMELDDILVRYLGFHKVSSVVDKTITTSSIGGIEKFREYLDRGWTLDVVPGIFFDKEKDDLVEVNFNWYYISEYLEKKLNRYDGKGKILIKNK